MFLGGAAATGRTVCILVKTVRGHYNTFLKLFPVLIFPYFLSPVNPAEGAG